MTEFRTQLRHGLGLGIRRGWSSFVWMGKIIIPFSLLISLVQWTGWLAHVQFLLDPLMGLINLPGEAALPIITGMVINIYATLAIITVIPFSAAQMTLIGVFALIAHNLVVEGIVQLRSGINIIKATFVRTAAAIITVLAISPFLGDTSGSVIMPATAVVQPAFFEFLGAWSLDILGLLMKILIIVMAISIVMESIRTLEWEERVIRFFRPFMGILGLSRRSAMPWVTAVIFGLMYGGAIIMEEARKRILTRAELERLHISIGINHSMVEDPSLFAILGLNGFWLWIPRLIMAIIAVQAFRVYWCLRQRLHPSV